jgi:hypothetical protein
MSDKNSFGVLSFDAGDAAVDFRFDEEKQVIWANVASIAELFGVDDNTVRSHIANIYKDEELQELGTTSKFEVVQIEGGRNVKRELLYYNLDMILSVGYRVNAKRAVRFRQWATDTLRTYIEQGYIINEKILRSSPEKLNKLAAEIRALRAEEKQVYAKVRECFKISASDYDPSSKTMRKFYALLQDKFHHAVTRMTSSKLIIDRADYREVNMGLQTFEGKAPTIKDAQTGKNYLTENELYRLHLLSEQFLLYAESTALAGKRMTMEGLFEQLDRLLTLNDYPVFDGYNDYIKQEAMEHAQRELKMYRQKEVVEHHGLEFDELSYMLGDYDHIFEESATA